MIATAYLGLGANLGQPQQQLQQAVQHLLAQGALLLAQSSYYRTPPWGRVDQPDFVNQVVAVQWPADVFALHATTLAVEQRMGRVRTAHWGPRSIDIDILACDTLAVHTSVLQVPHPQLGLRAFVLVPWAQLAPDFVVPGLQKTVAELLAALPAHDVASVRPLGA